MLILFRLFTSNFSWTELTSITSLYFVDKSIFHSISWFIRTWARDIRILVYNGRASHFLDFLFYLSSFSLFTKFKSDIIASWTNSRAWCDCHWARLESFAISKTCSCFACFSFWNFGYLEIWSWSGCCIFNIFILAFFIWIELSRRRSFFW